MADWKDLFSDTEKLLISKVNGKEIPWKKLSVEQDMSLNRRFKDDLEKLEKQKVLLRMQGADTLVNETDLIRLPEDAYVKLSMDMIRQLFTESQDFPSGEKAEKVKTSTGSSNTETTDSTEPDSSET